MNQFSNETLKQLCKKSETEFPLLHQPGEKWVYGASTKILGDLLSKIEGLSLGDCLKKTVFDPLQMNETSFEPQENQAIPHRQADGKWVPGDKLPRIEAGDGGLISTARDYGKFLRCLLNDGKPLLSEKTFQQMTTNQIDDLFIETQPAANSTLTYPFPSGGGKDKFGLGFQIHLENKEGERNPGSYSWCGLLNTFFWVDPTEKIACVIFMQTLPLYDPVCIETLKGFENLLYKNL